jgi:hypothetical protein
MQTSDGDRKRESKNIFFFFLHVTSRFYDNKKHSWQKRMPCACACYAMRTDLTADEIYRMWTLWILTCHVNTTGKSQRGNKSINVVLQSKARAQLSQSKF